MRNIPVISISERTLAEAYEAAILAVYQKGTWLKPNTTNRKTPKAWTVL